MNKTEKATLIKERRSLTISKDNQKKKQKFLDWFLVRNFDLKVFEMYATNGEVIKSKKIIPQYYFEYKYANTRTNTQNETRAEIDKLDFEKTMKIICEICLSLIRNKVRFCVFYAEGQRSPHVIAFDIYGLDKLTPFKREKAQAKFWKRIIPFAFHWLDHSIWSDEHYVPLEFASHWKYQTPFNLIFEYIPEVEQCKTL